MPTIDDILRAQRRQNIFDRVSSGSSSTAPAPPSVFERLSQGLTEPLPMEGRLSFLPAMVTPERGREWAVPGVLAGAWNAFSAPGRALRGEPVGEDEALNFAGSVMTGGMPVASTGYGIAGTAARRPKGTELAPRNSTALAADPQVALKQRQLVDFEQSGREASRRGEPRNPPPGPKEIQEAWLRGWDQTGLAHEKGGATISGDPPLPVRAQPKKKGEWNIHDEDGYLLGDLYR